jgi:hypothetical protein
VSMTRPDATSSLRQDEHLTSRATTVGSSPSFQVSRPKEKHQYDGPNDTPSKPSDVGVIRLPFQDSFMKGHHKYPSLLSSH